MTDYTRHPFSIAKEKQTNPFSLPGYKRPLHLRILLFGFAIYTVLGFVVLSISPIYPDPALYLSNYAKELLISWFIGLILFMIANKLDENLQETHLEWLHNIKPNRDYRTGYPLDFWYAQNKDNISFPPPPKTVIPELRDSKRPSEKIVSIFSKYFPKKLFKKLFFLQLILFLGATKNTINHENWQNY